MINQDLIDQMEQDNISDSVDELQEAVGMFLVDEEIEDLADAQEDLLRGGLSESGRLIDIVDTLEEEDI